MMIVKVSLTMYYSIKKKGVCTFLSPPAILSVGWFQEKQKLTQDFTTPLSKHRVINIYFAALYG